MKVTLISYTFCTLFNSAHHFLSRIILVLNILPTYIRCTYSRHWVVWKRSKWWWSCMWMNSCDAAIQRKSVCPIWRHWLKCERHVCFPCIFVEIEWICCPELFSLSICKKLTVLSPYLLPDSDVSLLDQDTCMVDGFCKPKLENLGLKTVPKYCVKS